MKGNRGQRLRQVMAAKNGGSGFDADKFRKLFRMFDSNYIEEAVTAFRLAVAELKKKQAEAAKKPLVKKK